MLPPPPLTRSCAFCRAAETASQNGKTVRSLRLPQCKAVVTRRMLDPYVLRGACCYPSAHARPRHPHGGTAVNKRALRLHYGAGNMLARAGAQRRGERTVPTPRAKPCTALGNRLARLRTRLKVPTTQSEEQKTRIQKRPCKERFNSPSCEKPRFLFRPVRQLSPSRP